MPDDRDRVVIVQSASKLKIASAIGGFIIIVVILGVFAWFIKSMRDENIKLRTEIVAQKKLTETLIRSSTRWATKDDLKSRLGELLTTEDREALEKDIKDIDAKLMAVGKIIGTVKRKVSKLEKSDREGSENPKVVKCDDGRLVDVHGYTKKEQIKDLKDSNNAPIGVAKFNAVKNKPWKYEIYGREYHLSTAVGKRENGQMTFHHTLKYKVPSKSNKLYSVSLTTSEYLQVPENNRWFWWNPKLDFGVFVGGKIHSAFLGSGRSDSLFSFGADIGFSFMSYGSTEVESIWRFIRFSAGYDAERKSARFSFSPVMFNLGNPMPLITNLYIHPQIGFDTAGGLTVGLGIGLQL